MLELLDLDKKLTKLAYSRRMDALQERLRQLQYAAQQAQIPVTVCLEGWDGCGRGEVVKKLAEKLDPRLFRIRRMVAPTALEQRYHFLWRYQIELPNDGEMVVFDHSWYGRVLVERCDRLVKKKVWRPAYQQINEFERWLADDGQVVIKLWMHISKQEQRQRFRAWKRDALLRVKLTKEYRQQHRHSGRWLKAVEEMLEKTSTSYAPWTAIEAHDLRWARVRIFETLVKRVEQALEDRRARPNAVSRTAAAAAALAETPVGRREKAATRPARLARRRKRPAPKRPVPQIREVPPRPAEAAVAPSPPHSEVTPA